MGEEEVKKRGFLSRLSEALFKEVDAATTNEIAAPADAPKPAADTTATSTVDEQLRKDLLQQLADDGPLLGQFLDLAASLAELIPQESASYQAALRALEKTGGTGKDDLLAAVDRQLATLEREKAAFAESVQKKLTAQQAATLKSDEIRARIGELQKAIQALESEEQQLFAKVASEEKLIRTAQLRFDSTTREVERELRGQLEKLRNYLPDNDTKKQ